MTTAAALAHHTDVAAGVRDWIIAVASLIAAVGAAWAAVPAVRAYRQSIRDRHREHASKFSVWAGGAKLSAPGSIRDGATIGWQAYVRNSSDEPMYRVVVMFRDGRDPTKSLATGDPVLDVLPPGATRAVSGRRIPKDPELPGVFAEAGFTDRAGVRWYRDWRGGLTEQPHFTLDTTPP